MSLPCGRISETRFSILGGQYQGNASLSPNRGLAFRTVCRLTRKLRVKSAFVAVVMQRNESTHSETVSRAIVYSVRIGPLQSETSLPQ